jgi:hypothetical protein
MSEAVKIIKAIRDPKEDKYQVWYDEAQNTVFFEGSLRLNGLEDYAAISGLLEDIFKGNPKQMILDLRKLEFLNSSGISVLARFSIFVRKQKSETLLKIVGAEGIPWQGKSLPNLKKLNEAIDLSYG